MRMLRLGLLVVIYDDRQAIVLSPNKTYYTVSTDGTIKAIDLLVDVLYSRRDLDNITNNSNSMDLNKLINSLEDTIPIDIRKAG